MKECPYFVSVKNNLSGFMEQHFLSPGVALGLHQP
jgi:hypothetical protein